MQIYAAFSYAAERDDELNFAAGDELRVVTRETGEHGHLQHLRAAYQHLYGGGSDGGGDVDDEESVWWLAEDAEGKRGLVPRNFFGLYPTWQHRERHAFRYFELPATPTALNALLRSHGAAPSGGGDDEASGDSRRNSSATLDPCGGDDTTADERSSDGGGDRSPDAAQLPANENSSSPSPLPKPDFDASMQITVN